MKKEIIISRFNAELFYPAFDWIFESRTSNPGINIILSHINDKIKWYNDKYAIFKALRQSPFKNSYMIQIVNKSLSQNCLVYAKHIFYIIPCVFYF